MEKEIVRLMRVIASPVIIIFGTIGNLLILFIMRKEPLKKTPICFYVSILAVTDTGMMFFFQFYESDFDNNCGPSDHVTNSFCFV